MRRVVSIFLLASLAVLCKVKGQATTFQSDDREYREMKVTIAKQEIMLAQQGQMIDQLLRQQGQMRQDMLEMRQDIMLEVRHEVMLEMRQDIMQEVRKEIIQEMRQDVMLEMRKDVMQEVRQIVLLEAHKLFEANQFRSELEIEPKTPPSDQTVVELNTAVNSQTDSAEEGNSVTKR
jgi:hypothetical protein